MVDYGKQVNTKTYIFRTKQTFGMKLKPLVFTFYWLTS